MLSNNLSHTLTREKYKISRCEKSCDTITIFRSFSLHEYDIPRSLLSHLFPSQVLSSPTIGEVHMPFLSSPPPSMSICASVILFFYFSFLRLRSVFHWACDLPLHASSGTPTRPSRRGPHYSPFVLLLSWLHVRIVTLHRLPDCFRSYHPSPRIGNHAYRFHVTSRPPLEL